MLQPRGNTSSSTLCLSDGTQHALPDKWSGFCSCCKRPVEVKLSTQPSEERVSRTAPQARGRFAYVICLWGSSKDYVLGALVLGHSIRRTGTKHSLVCLHASDVPLVYVNLLRKFWDCRQVDHVEVKAAKQLSTDDNIEESRFQKVFTKLRALELVDFEKVLVMDIDLLVMSNVDDLFQLQAPAALKRSMQRGYWRYRHGDEIDGRSFFQGANPGQDMSWGQGSGINAGVMLWSPDLEEFQAMQDELAEPGHPGHVRGNGPEQDYLSRYWADRPWRHISVENNFQLHHMFNALHPHIVDGAERVSVCKDHKSIRIVHYSGESSVKPWSRCLQEAWRWPERDQDEEYNLRFAGDLNAYLLWVVHDKEIWARMTRNTYPGSDLSGFRLGDDGVIYYKDKHGIEAPKETPQEAKEAAMAVMRYKATKNTTNNIAV
ncbi:unnamed protein product [Polarella glacialis]|uniref:Hexosyltransferase n=1 Tax=Polarella glacialis TaxID=89957 RepID=A0A813DPI3_POLGL|nr:unnamed protein product [Polarella glacialis]